jgi:hypothetical protein
VCQELSSETGKVEVAICLHYGPRNQLSVHVPGVRGCVT